MLSKEAILRKGEEASRIQGTADELIETGRAQSELMLLAKNHGLARHLDFSKTSWLAFSRGLAERLHPTDVCSRCETDEDDHLCDVTVVTMAGEEGYSEVTQLLCEDCSIEVIDQLQQLGFKSHHHGSTDLLADQGCPADGADGPCPTPHGYGPITVKNPHRNQTDDLEEDVESLYYVSEEEEDK